VGDGLKTCSITEICHRIVRCDIRDGDVAIDATAGNGFDSLFLAQAVGATGRVYAFDIQSAALTATRELLDAHGVMERVDLRLGCHSGLETLVPTLHHGVVRVVLFNLGYLPGGDKAITTERDKTLMAVQQAFALLCTLGHVCIVVYPGYAAGLVEADAVMSWALSFAASQAHVATYRMVNREATAPYLIHVQKAAV
jgi:hypothetical protein